MCGATFVGAVTDADVETACRADGGQEAKD